MHILQARPITSRHGLKARSLSVLVVEDSIATADILGMFFETLGHKVRVAYDGREALTQAYAEVPDLIVMDLGLPEMNGFETMSEIRRLQGDKRVVAIALSGFDDDEIIARCAVLGFDAYFSKPADPLELEELVQTFF